VREADGVRAWVHIADVSAFVPAGSPLDRGAAGPRFSTYVPGLVAPMLPPELSNEHVLPSPACRARMCDSRVPPVGEPLFYRSLIRSDARLTYGQAQRRDVPAEVSEELELAASYSPSCAAGDSPAGALRVERPEIAFDFDGRGGVAAARWEGEPDAHALDRGADDHRERGGGRACSPAATARRFFASLNGPSRSRCRSRSQARRPRRPDAAGAGSAARRRCRPRRGRRERARQRLRRQVRPRARGVPGARAPLAQAGPLRPAQPRSLGPREARPTAISPSPIRRYPDLVVHRALLRELGVSDEPLPEHLGDLAEHTSAREREAAELEYLADDICLAWLLEAQLFDRGWDEPWPGRSPA
jgi:ribonuclease R